MPTAQPNSNQFRSNDNVQVRPLSPTEYQQRLRELMKPTTPELRTTEMISSDSDEKNTHQKEAVQELEGLREQEGRASERMFLQESEKIRTIESMPEASPVETNKEPVTQSEINQETPEATEFTDPEVLSLHLPLSKQEMEQGMDAPLSSAWRWLAGWTDRQIKKLHPENFKKFERKSLEMVYLEIAVPKENEIEISAAETLFSNLTSLYKKNGFFYSLPFIASRYDPQVSIAFEIVAEPGVIRFVVAVPKEVADFVEKQIHAAYPIAEISHINEYDVFEKEGEVVFTELQISGPAYYPIRTHEELKADGLSAITNSLSKLQEHEAAVVQFVLTPVSKNWSSAGRSYVRNAEKPPKEGEKPKNVDPEKLEGIKQKVSKAGLGVVIRVVCVSPQRESATTNLDNIVGSFQQFSHPHLARFQKAGTNLLDKVKRRSFSERFLYRYFPAFSNASVLNVEELATILHFPNKNIQTPNIKWLLFKRSEPPANLPSEGLYLGYSEFRGEKRKVYLQPDDRRRHMYILGQTGTGKSEFMMSLAAQDIREGRGLAFIDPHGDAVEELLKVVPKERAEDVIYFDPSDTERPMGLNILEATNEQAKHMAVNAFIALLYKLYDPGHTGIIGPQLERTVRNVMLTAMSEPGNSMIEVMRLILDPEFVKQKLEIIEDPLVRQYWEQEIAQTSDYHKSEKLGYIVSKFDRFVTEKLMRNIIGQGESAFDFRRVMDEQKILLINLAKGKIGEENSQFLGLLFVPRILTAAMSRADIPMEERKDFYLYVDEFQNFSTPDFAQILSEARKFRLCLIVANQFISQIDEKIRDAVFGNVGTMATLRAGSDDAQYLEHHFGPTFMAKDIMNLTIGNAYTKLLINGQPSTPFSMYSDYPSWKAVPRNEELSSMVRELSRLRYGRDREVVEAEIKIRAQLE